MNNIRPNTPTIPIKQIPSKKFIPLVIGTPNSDLKIPAKLFDVKLNKSSMNDFFLNLNLGTKDSKFYSRCSTSVNYYY